MTVFDAADFDDHEAVIYVREPDAGLRAIIAIHRSRGTTAGGGTRRARARCEAVAHRSRRGAAEPIAVEIGDPPGHRACL